MVLDNEILLGASPQTPWVGFAEFWVNTMVIREAEQRFLLLFLEKEETF
jgi:hypothetical protein